MIRQNIRSDNNYGRYFLATEAKKKTNADVEEMDAYPDTDFDKSSSEYYPDNSDVTEPDNTQNTVSSTPEDTDSDNISGMDTSFDDGTDDTTTEPTDSDNMTSVNTDDTDNESNGTEETNTDDTNTDGAEVDAPTDDMDTDFSDTDTEDNEDTGNDTNADTSNGSTGDDKKDGPGMEYDSTRKSMLFKEYMNLYNALCNYISRLENYIKDDSLSNKIINKATKSLKEIRDLTYDYMIMKFELCTYVESLVFYQKLIVAVQLVFNLLGNLTVIEKK